MIYEGASCCTESQTQALSCRVSSCVSTKQWQLVPFCTQQALRPLNQLIRAAQSDPSAEETTTEPYPQHTRSLPYTFVTPGRILESQSFTSSYSARLRTSLYSKPQSDWDSGASGACSTPARIRGWIGSYVSMQGPKWASPKTNSNPRNIVNVWHPAQFAAVRSFNHH